MSEIKELENRLSAALGRIGAALARPSEPVEDPRVAELGEALEAEKVVVAQLEARVASLRDKTAALEAEAARLAEELAARDALAQQLRRVNDQLRTSNDALRAAVVEGAADRQILDEGMMAELRGIRASREADRAEIDAVLAQLAPLLEASHA
jgi:hypothetical protein